MVEVGAWIDFNKNTVPYLVGVIYPSFMPSLEMTPDLLKPYTHSDVWDEIMEILLIPIMVYSL